MRQFEVIFVCVVEISAFLIVAARTETYLSLSCEDPGNIKNGRRIGNIFTFPNKVEFECEEGYKLVGTNTIHCQAGGEWSGKLPSCEPITCTVPPDLVNAEVIYYSLDYGAELRYRCYLGYMETHNEPRYCTADGTWNGTAPECIEARCIKLIPPKNGKVEIIGERKIGSIATYSCNPGLKLKGASTAECLIDGRWTWGPPRCLKTCSVPHIENGGMSRLYIKTGREWKEEETFIKISDGELVDLNVMLRFRCKENFTIVEGDTILEDVEVDVFCNDGNWSRDLHCKQTSDEELVNNGGEQDISTTELPKKTSSDEEFDNVEREQETTTTELPEKNLDLTCASPPEIEGSIAPRSEGNVYRVGQHVAYGCNYGYVSLNSRAHVSTCIVNVKTGKAEWTVPDIACIPRSCGDPGYVNNGRRIGNLFTFPNKVEFECEDGYKLAGMKTRYCQAGGEWSGRLPLCEPLTCSVPPDIVNGEVIYSSLEYGSELTYRCYLGYMETHNEQRYCDEDGAWSGEAPECIETRCPKPISPEYGEVHFIGEPKVGSIASYSCNPGLKLIGASTTKCLITGQWTFGPPKCVSSCSVPQIENGKMSKLSVRRIYRWRTEETYTPLSDGEHVEHEETLSFHCDEDFAIVEVDKVIENARIDVTCYDGKWSRDLHCKQTSCLGEPPEMEYGKAIVNSRRHGDSIWYRCDDRTDSKIKGNVTCYFGSWIGIPPQCLSTTPCFSKDLNFPGLVKPSKNRVTSSESFDIVCKVGYRLSTTATTITCKRGRWNITEDPCPLVYEDSSQSRPVIVQPLPLHVTPANPDDKNIQPPKQCHCTYAGAGHHVQATVGNGKLRDGDKVNQGTKVTFSCKGRGLLTWKNGFRMYGNASMTCNTCQKWEVVDNPDCKVSEGGGPFIILENSVDIQPGGVIEVTIKKPITLRCASSYHYPQWSFRGQPFHAIQYSTRQSGDTRHYFTNIYFYEISYENAGLYTCHFDPPRNFRRTVVVVRVKEDKCPLLAANQQVTYSNGNEIGSWATFSCPENTILIGDSQIVCQNDGTWSAPEPVCRAIVCTFFSTAKDLRVSYSDGNEVGSRATFSCPTHATLVGSEISECRGDGTWSSPGPYCLNKTTCAYFRQAYGLEIEYSNVNYPGSHASFSCPPGKVLNGHSFAVCQENGDWSHQTPTCEDKCSIEHLTMSVKEGIVPDMDTVTDEFVPFDSVVQLTCEGKLIPEGNSAAVCGEQGKWKIGKFECVSGCRLNIKPSSHLQVEPLKDSYRFGEAVTLSCPDGEKTTNNVERLMCLSEWSDAIPDCIPK